MTNHLPPDLDRLLWEVAESQDQGAFDDFEARFPHLVSELGKRIQLVRELRDARGNGSGRPVPRFDRRTPRQIGPNPKVVATFGVLAAACLAVAAFTVTKHFMASPRLEPVPHVIAGGPTLPSPGIVMTPGLGSGSAAPPENKQTPPQTPPPPDQPPYLRPQKLVAFERTKLQVAILAVATSGGLQVEFAPNMPNYDIRMEYRDMSALDIIQDLGPRFHFTAFRQTGNQILIVPATDPNAGQLPAATGTGFAAKVESDPEPVDPVPRRARKTQSQSTGPS
ncbi:MAG TPA: hypothetical protein VKT78_14515 [Fimbriimonadaceae bacterium]|nr:hypothetical protein [Fimbriimonadaceae bacterium]